MNEITKIHLGRQAFTISVDAHKALQEYLHAIKRRMGDDEVVEEVEIRIAELLTDRGIKGDKVVLAKDVEYVKEQLGKPGDFGEGDADAEDSEKSEKASEDSAPKRLFRDTENGMIAGVAAGIGKYTGTDPLWIRIIFVLLTLAGASGVLLYIILWLLVPEAKTSSDRLQMQGKPVTVDSLKDVVDRADVKGAAKRASDTVGKVVGTGLKVLLAIVGISLMVAGVGAILSLITGSVYFALNHATILPFGIFPVGAGEKVLIAMALVAAGMLSLFLLFGGLAMVKRRAPLPGWAVGTMVAVFLVAVSVGSALGADAGPKIRDRFEAAHHSQIRAVEPFTDVQVIGNQDSDRLVEVQRRVSNDYKVEIRYLGDQADPNQVVTKMLKPGSLEVDASAFTGDGRCKHPCAFADLDLQVFIYAPADKNITIQGEGGVWTAIPGEPMDTPPADEPVDETEPATNDSL